MSLGWDKSEYSDFIEYLIKAIYEEESVHNALIYLFNQENIKTLDERNINEDAKKAEEMRCELEELHSKNARLQDELMKYKNENEKISVAFAEKEQLLKLQNIKLQAEIDDLKSRFQTVLFVFECYRKLSPSLRNSLSGIFRGNSLEEFIFCGVQRQNMELLWDTIKMRAIDENYDELEQLTNIYQFFFDAYNRTFETPLYKLQEVSENESFDNDKHLRTSKSSSSGVISKVIFRGYINNNNNKLERKTVVKI